MPFSVARVERVSGSFAVEEIAARREFLDYLYLVLVPWQVPSAMSFRPYCAS